MASSTVAHFFRVLSVKYASRSVRKEPLGFGYTDERLEPFDGFDDDLDVTRLVRIRTRRFVRVVLEKLFGGALRGAPVFAYERADVEQKMSSRVEHRIETRVIAPDRLVALGMGKNGHEPGAAQIEKAL